MSRLRRAVLVVLIFVAGDLFVLEGLAIEPTRLGPEIRVDEGAGSPSMPRIGVDAAGNFSVAWQGLGGEGCGICVRSFDADGNAVGSPVEVHDEGVLGPYFDESLDVDVSESGGFVVGWTGFDYDIDFPTCQDYCLLYRRFGPGDTPLGPTESAGPLTERAAASAEVGILDSGGFAVAWHGYTEGYEVSARVFEADGAPKTEGFRVNAGPGGPGDYGYFSMDASSRGRFVVVWHGYYGEGLQEGIFGRGFDANGRVDHRDFVVAPNGPGDGPFYFSPEVAVAESGDFVVAWLQSNEYLIRARMFGADLEPDGPVILVSGRATGGFDPGPEEGGIDPDVATDSQGNFVVVWKGRDADGWGVFARAFDALGNPRGDAFAVNTSTDGRQGYRHGVDVAVDEEARFVITWSDDALGGVLAQRFELPPVTEVHLAGQRLKITNGVPSSPRVRQVAWKSKAGNVRAGERGSDRDPRCNGDPPDTVKARLRFFSLDSGNDTGAMDLPCQNWQATGPAGNPVRQGYRYSDPKLDDGLCKRVVLRHGKELKAICKGRVGGPDVAYDLTEGVGEGTVHATLDIGGMVYCSEFVGTQADGSDGRRFLGRSLPTPDDCPS